MKHERLEPHSQRPKSRARELRRNVVLPAHILLESGEITSVDVLDLSYDGCCVETPIELPEQSVVKLSVVALGTVDAKVCWYAAGKAGLSFAVDSKWDREIQPRNVTRLELTGHILLRRVGRKHYRARIFDISPLGCKVEFVERPRLDELVWVKFDCLDAIEAEVCWVRGFYGGLKFLRPIYPSVFDLLLTKLQACNIK